MSSNQFFEWVKRQYERYPLAFHAPGWLLYMVLPYLILPLRPLFNQRGSIELLGIKLLDDVLCIAFFYMNWYWLTPAILRHHRLYRLVLAVLGMCGVLTLMNGIYYRAMLDDDFTQLATTIKYSEVGLLEVEYVLGIPLPLMAYPLFSMILLTIISSAFVIYQDRNLHKARHQAIIIEKKEAELTALKLQISPHFLFNTLNNLRWMARQQSTQTEGAILRLSDLLRYMIYQVDQGPVSLTREIDYLTDYIELQQLRLAPHNQIIFECESVPDSVLVEPLLLIHFVENAVKHGLHHEQASTVTIRLAMKQDSLLFSTRNTLYTRASADVSTNTGIGIQNVERRLMLHYPDQHTLRIYQEKGKFCVDLRIDLNPSLYETPQHSH